MFQGLETRQIRNNQGAVRSYYRYAGQIRWYRHIATAQRALQMRG